MQLPRAIDALVAEFGRFPGVGKRSAERMALDLLTGNPDRIAALAHALGGLESISICKTCGYFKENGECLVCGPGRNDASMLVVEKPMDVIAFEKSGGFRGRYHVLGGHLSPLKGITPEKLRIAELENRCASTSVTELILATSASVEGDATALYLSRLVAREGLLITRLGRGMPMGGTLEFTDAGTLRMALEGRRGIDS